MLLRRAHRSRSKGNAHLRQPNTCAHAESRKPEEQAKKYLRWHRERYYPVAAEIRAGLPRFRQLGDAQILEANFKLADAQELVARQMGFDGWQALKSGADAMTDERRQTTPRPILNSIEAQLFVANIQSSCDFYTNKLGFAVEFCLWRSAVLRTGPSRQCTAQLEARLRTCVCGRYPQARASAFRFDHGCHRERDQTIVSELPGCRSLVLSDAQERAMGCARFHCDGSGRESHPVCRSGGMKCGACHYV